MSAAERTAVREERLKELVMYAKANSPYFAKLYSGIDIGDSFSSKDLPKLPPTSKAGLMADFENWVTDREVRLAEIEKLVEDPANIGTPYLGKYLVLTTSGTTGKPGIVIYNRSAMNVLSAVHRAFTFIRGRDYIRWIMRGATTATIVAADAFNGTNVMSHILAEEDPKLTKKSNFINLFDPIPNVVESLNRLKPAMIFAYPTLMKILTEEKRAGRLHVSPVLITSGGEHLNIQDRKEIEGAFGCPVQSAYGCTEGGPIAHDCRHKRLHLHDGWIIMEPVDKNNEPVPCGSMADKWFMTALASYAQPIIRYEVSDRIILHDEGCPCGDPSPWVEVEGRIEETFTCPGIDRDVNILPSVLYETMTAVEGIREYQVVLRKDRDLELRIVADDRALGFERASGALQRILDVMGATSKIVLSEDRPQLEPKSGKLRKFKIEK
jgi:phenylacetate-coenzyme A ligase PaaK-like adenylate-forming protein